MKYSNIFYIIISLTLFSCYYHRDARRYCNCKTSNNNIISDSIYLDSLKLFYKNIHMSPESEFRADSEVIQYAISVKNIKTTTDKKILKKIDSTIRKTDIINNLLNNQNLSCYKSRKKTNIRITDVYVLYYDVKGEKREIYISYYKISPMSNEKLFFVMGYPTNRYKCPLLLGSLMDAF